jgi:hypothetical protein
MASRSIHAATPGALPAPAAGMSDRRAPPPREPDDRRSARYRKTANGR